MDLDVPGSSQPRKPASKALPRSYLASRREGSLPQIPDIEERAEIGLDIRSPITDCVSAVNSPHGMTAPSRLHLPRALLDVLRVARFPVVVVTGARLTGRSTLTRRIVGYSRSTHAHSTSGNLGFEADGVTDSSLRHPGVRGDPLLALPSSNGMSLNRATPQIVRTGITSRSQSHRDHYSLRTHVSNRSGRASIRSVSISGR